MPNPIPQMLAFFLAGHVVEVGGTRGEGVG